MHPLLVKPENLISASPLPCHRFVGKKTREQVLQALRGVHAGELIDRRVGLLSGGELQRVLLALALTPVPQLLILDEPVSGVDQNGLVMFLDTVTRLKHQVHMAVLLVSHDWDMVRHYADRAILLEKKVLAEGTPEQVFASDAFDRAFPLKR